MAIQILPRHGDAWLHGTNTEHGGYMKNDKITRHERIKCDVFVVNCKVNFGIIYFCKMYGNFC